MVVDLCARFTEIPTVMHSRFPSSVVVLRVESNEGYVMSLHFFPKDLNVNANFFIETHYTGVKRWIGKVAGVESVHVPVRLWSLSDSQ